MLRRFTFWSIILLCAAECAFGTRETAQRYRVARHFKLGGDGGWDYLTLDPATHRLFISRSTHVVVLDVESGKVVGDIANTDGVHGIALAPELHRGFISDGRTSTVTVFDLDSLKRLEDAKIAGEHPDAILYEPVTKRVFTFNAASHDASVLDATTAKQAGTVPLGGKPEFAQADGHGNVFVNIEDTSEIAEIDARSLKVEKRWKLTGCESPTGLALDRAGMRLFSGCENEVMVVSDASAGKVIGKATIGKGVDGVAFDDERHLAFSSNGGSGTLTVVAARDDHFEVVENVETKRGARTLTIDPKSGHIFVITADFGPPPAATAEHPHPRPSIVAGTFEVIEIAPSK